MIAGKSHKMSLETSIWTKKALITLGKGLACFHLQQALSLGDVRSGEPVLGAPGLGQPH